MCLAARGLKDKKARWKGRAGGSPWEDMEAEGREEVDAQFMRSAFVL